MFWVGTDLDVTGLGIQWAPIFFLAGMGIPEEFRVSAKLSFASEAAEGQRGGPQSCGKLH